MGQLIMNILFDIVCVLIMLFAAGVGILMLVTAVLGNIGKVISELPDWLLWWYAAGRHD
ncbi:MAG: hypothetical protein LBR34_09525 [Prevotella sp.]|jgi:hypothetical protein|nr:hypothetical protein [Prevotella sp.]